LSRKRIFSIINIYFLFKRREIIILSDIIWSNNLVFSLLHKQDIVLQINWYIYFFERIDKDVNIYWKKVTARFRKYFVDCALNLIDTRVILQSNSSIIGRRNIFIQIIFSDSISRLAFSIFAVDVRQKKYFNAYWISSISE